MKILHFASGDLWAGAEVQLFHLAKKLSALDFVELRVVLLNPGRLEDELRRHGVKVDVFDETQLSGFAILKKLNNIVKEYQPQIIHTHRSKENVIGSLIAKWNGKKSIRTVHGAPEFSASLFDLRRLVFDGLDRFSGIMLQQKIVAVSHDLKHKLEKKYSSKKIEVIENCVDTDYIEKMSEQAPQALLNPEFFNVAFVGRFVPVKRTDLFCDIAKSVLSIHSEKPVHFHMLGDGPLQEEVALRISREHLDSNIHLYGFVDNVAPMLKQMDLLVFTSDHEGLPMTLLEAMTLGVPVLSRNNPSIRKVTCDGECGFIVKSNTIEDFSGIILQLANDEQAAKTKIEMASKTVYEKYSITENAKSYLALYENVLAK